MINAVGTSLVAVTASGSPPRSITRFRDWSLWPLAGIFIAGGIAGSIAGARMARHLSSKGHLVTVFAILIFVVAAYMLWKHGRGALAPEDLVDQLAEIGETRSLQAIAAFGVLRGPGGGET